MSTREEVIQVLGKCENLTLRSLKMEGGLHAEECRPPTAGEGCQQAEMSQWIKQFQADMRTRVPVPVPMPMSGRHGGLPLVPALKGQNQWSKQLS